MPNPLPLHPAPIPRETLPSYVARLAAWNFVSTTELGLDLGLPLKRVVHLDPEIVTRVGELAGLSSAALADLVSWTGERIGDVRMRLRAEVFLSRAVRNPVVRGCPICLREDAEQDHEQPLRAMAMRGDWQLREVLLCVRHRHRLVRLWEVGHPVQRHDIGARLAEIMPHVLDGSLERLQQEPSPYDLWLERRLEDGHDPTALADQSLYATTTVCRLLGTELLRLNIGDDAPRQPGDDAVLRDAQAAGFAVLSKGLVAFREALGWLVEATDDRALIKPQGTFGGLYVKLDTDLAGDAAFEPYRRALRDCILDVWPVASGEVVLGEALPRRRLHSLVTASAETGISQQTMSRLLVEAGALSHDVERPLVRQTFDASALAPFLEGAQGLVTRLDMCRAMGATLPEFAALIADGAIRPWTKAEKVRQRWRPADGTALVADLTRLSTPVGEDDRTWVSFFAARTRTGIGLDILHDAVRTGFLTVGQRTGVTGYHGLAVPHAEVDALRQARAAQADAHEPSASRLVSFAAFARSVRLGPVRLLKNLADAGHVSMTLVTHPATKQSLRYLSPEDVASFHRRFVTVATIAGETGLHHSTVRMHLAAAKVEPVSSEAPKPGGVYLREEAARIFPTLLASGEPRASQRSR